MNARLLSYCQMHQLTWSVNHWFSMTRLQVHSIDLYLYTIFNQRRLDIIDQIKLKYGVHNRLHIYPLCGIFYFHWHRHQVEGTNGF